MLGLVLLGLVLVLFGSTLVAGQRRMGSLRNVPS